MYMWVVTHVGFHPTARSRRGRWSVSSTRIREPADMDLRIDAARFVELLQTLTVEQKDQLIAEWAAALVQAKAANDCRPIQATANAWYLSMLFLARPSFHEALEWAANV